MYKSGRIIKLKQPYLERKYQNMGVIYEENEEKCVNNEHISN